MGCVLCPRKCSVSRDKGEKGFCGAGNKVRIARADLHYWEEPCISGKNGSGTVFFSGCNLKCCFCQNHEISADCKGFDLDDGELAETFLMLQEKGAHNINLVTGTPYIDHIVKALDIAGDSLNIPVVYNCGGYESDEGLDMLKGRVDIFLPDIKYYSGELSKKYSSCANYFEKASNALKRMVQIAGKPVFGENGLMKRGVMVRHLVLPNQRHDSAEIIRWLSESFGQDEILVSLMSQFTPVYKARDIKELNRRTSTFEYNYVCKLLEDSGFDGFFQQRGSADESFIPEFFDSKYY